CADFADREFLRGAVSVARRISGNVLSLISRPMAQTSPPSAANRNTRLPEIRSCRVGVQWGHLHCDRSSRLLSKDQKDRRINSRRCNRWRRSRSAAEQIVAHFRTETRDSLLVG